MPHHRHKAHWLGLVAIGLIAGFLSGLFGVGGGVLIVPALTLLLAFDQRTAAGTSLAAIVPVGIVGVLSYALNGSVDWIAAGLLALAAIVGAQIGSHLLNRLPLQVLRWGFIGFLVVVIVSLFLVTPTRDAVIDLTVWSVLGLLALGLVVGILSGLLGIGGGVVVVPMLIVLFGASDLVARGTSLLMIIPTAISGTIGNVIRRNVDLPAAAVIGVTACTTTALGALAAVAIDPAVANLLFAIFVAAIAVQLTVKAWRSPR
ncbi:putative membrane protein YfcA [Mycetocola sp. CAN_C7]|uniref:sulfite exporter TauE/SafE family protein n=1 Tax=Mycetocola sp. CAN_C7 TaxID=2787724 RepID=UPI0018CAF6B6